MVYLISDGRACGMASFAEVRTLFTSLDDARAQAEHDQETGRTPLRIEDADTGDVLLEFSP